MDTDALPALIADQVDLFLNPPSERLSKASHNAQTGQTGKHTSLSARRENCLSVILARSKITRASSWMVQQKATTINRKLCGIKAGLIGFLQATYGKEKAEVLKNAYKVVKGVKLSKNERAIRPENVLSEDEIERLIQAADPKAALIIRFLSKTGTRISEALHHAG